MLQKSRFTRGFWLGLVILVVVLDQFTKWIATEHIQGQPRQEFLGGFFVLQYAENPGAFLSMGASLPDELRFIIFVLAVAVFLMIVAFFLFFRPQTPLASAVFALLLGGGIGNLIDRSLRENGQVIDFMNMGIGGLRTGIFNVADFAIVLAIGFGIMDFIAESKAKKKQA